MAIKYQTRGLYGYTHRKYDKRFSNKKGRIKRTTTSLKKQSIPMVRHSGQNAFIAARTNEGFAFFLHSSRHFLQTNKLNFKYFVLMNDFRSIDINCWYLSSRSPSILDRSSFNGALTSHESKALLYVRLNNGIDQPKNIIDIQLAVSRGFDNNFLCPDSILLTVC